MIFLIERVPYIRLRSSPFVALTNNTREINNSGRHQNVKKWKIVRKLLQIFPSLERAFPREDAATNEEIFLGPLQLQAVAEDEILSLQHVNHEPQSRGAFADTTIQNPVDNAQDVSPNQDSKQEEILELDDINSQNLAQDKSQSHISHILQLSDVIGHDEASEAPGIQK